MAMLRRLLVVFLALMFFVGVIAQLVPADIALGEASVHADMAGGCTGPQPPCTGHMPNCVDHVGCMTLSALPTCPASLFVPVAWVPFEYSLAPEWLAGISVEPELSPPILAA